MKKGAPFSRLKKLVGRLRHAAIGIPAGKYLFGPVNQLMAIRPKQVYWDRCPTARLALEDWGQLYFL